MGSAQFEALGRAKGAMKPSIHLNATRTGGTKGRANVLSHWTQAITRLFFYAMHMLP